MHRMTQYITLVFGLALALGLFYSQSIQAQSLRRQPNIILLFADDLGYGDLGSYDQDKIKTPVLDQLAKDGMLFTQCYAGSTVCAPARCTLMTGKHTGHCRVRGNGGCAGRFLNVALTKDDVTVADVLKKAGYKTALIGKWGLGEEGSTGVPNLQGFDYFFGYLNQYLAHNYYPDFLWRNREKVPLDNPQSDIANVAAEFNVYAPDLFREEAIQFIDDNHKKPFFLYFSTTVPHANNEKAKALGEGNEVPTDAPYSDKPWPQAEKNKAAMITRLDSDIGKILDRLKVHDIEKDTIVIFTSDNGPHKEGGNDPAFFKSAGPLRGLKRDLYEGGIRMPGIVRWPGVVKPGSVSDHVWAFWDFLPTATELAGAPAPATIDGISFAPTIVGRGEQRKHRFLYWEFHEGGFKQAVRHGDWKAVRLAPNKPLELYNLAKDIGETTNVAGENKDIVMRIEEYLKTARTDSPEFPVRVPMKKAN